MGDFNTAVEKTKEQKVLDILDQEIFTPVEVEHGKNAEPLPQGYDIKKLKDQKNILDLVDKEDLVLSQTEKAQAGIYKNRLSAQILLSNQKKSADNKEMREVKESIIALETLLSSPMTDETFNKDYVDRVDKAYDTVIKKCYTYVNKKNPFFKKGIERKQLVQQQMEAMQEERVHFERGARYVKQNGLGAYIHSAYEILSTDTLTALINKKDARTDVLHFNDYAENPMQEVNTPEYEKVCGTLKVIDSFLREPFPGDSVIDTKTQVDELSFITMMHNRLLGEINICLNGHFGGNMALHSQLLNLRQWVAGDQEFMQKNVESYRKYLKENPKEAKKATWYDALHFVRAAGVNLDDKMNNEVKVMGEGSSVVYEITEKDTKKKSYFQKDQITFGTEYFAENYVQMYPELDTKEKREMYSYLLNGYSAYCGNLYGTNDINDIHAIMADMSKKKKPEDLAKIVMEKVPMNLWHAKYTDQKLLGEMLKEYPKFMLQQGICRDAGITVGNRLTGRNVATSRLAKLLGFGNAICESRTAVAKINGKTVKGNVMDSSGGEASRELLGENLDLAEEGKLTYEDQVVSDLLDLRVFDYICGQIDRHMGNIHLNSEKNEKTGEIKITGVKGIDNDICFGEFTFEDLCNKNHSHLMGFDNMVLEGLSDNFIKQLDSLSKPLIDALLGDLLTKNELNALWDRISGIQKELRKKDKLLSDAKKTKGNDPGENKTQYIRQYKALKKMKDEYVSDDNSTPQEVFTDEYIEKQLSRLGKSA